MGEEKHSSKNYYWLHFSSHTGCRDLAGRRTIGGVLELAVVASPLESVVTTPIFAGERTMQLLKQVSRCSF